MAAICLQAKKKKYFFGILILLIFHFISNFIWCSQDWITLEDDMSDHLESHLNLYYGLKQSIAQREGTIPNMVNMLKEILKYNSLRYSSFVYTISVFLNLMLLNSSILITRFSMFLFFAILILSVYGIGKYMIGAYYGMIAAILVSLYPAILGPSRLYYLDFPLTCISSLAVYFLLKTNFFSSRKNSLFFGLSLGIGILVKAPMLIIILGPLCYTIYVGISRKKNCVKKEIFASVFNLVGAILIAGFVSAIWWAPRFFDLWERFCAHVVVSSVNSEIPHYLGGIMVLPIFSLNWFLCYVYFLINNLSPILFLVFVLGLFFMPKVKVNREHKTILIFWLFVPIILFTFCAVKKDRFIMPVIPAMAIITSIFFFSIKNKNKRIFLVLAVIVFAVSQALFLSYYPKSNELTLDSKKNSIFYFITPMHRPKIVGIAKDSLKCSFVESPCIQPHRLDINFITKRLIEKMDFSHKNQNINIAMFYEKKLYNQAFCIRYALKSKSPYYCFFQLNKWENVEALMEKEPGVYCTAKRDSYDFIITLSSIRTLTKKIFPDNSEFFDDYVKKKYVDKTEDYFLVDRFEINQKGFEVSLFKKSITILN
ncbi:MAG: glycosyltransferase family 39 protein [Candidatus Omnitrophota bacterium]